jgi:alpha-glucoside transport system permease protein
VGLDNYIWFIQDRGTIEALRNSVLWVVFMTAGVVGLGLLIAILVDRVRYEPIAKSVIFVPLAISFVAAGIIWQFMYQYQDPSRPQTGTLNALIGLVGLGPTRFTQEEPLNNFALIFIGVWMWTGFAMVILSAGLKGISTELLEAARVDGANEWQVFKGIILPLLMPTIFVVGTTIVITALKSFDIVFTVTNGNFGTDVIAREMWQQMFTPPGNFGRASAVAIVLLLAIIPFMAVNVKRFREQEAIR